MEDSYRDEGREAFRNRDSYYDNPYQYGSGYDSYRASQDWADGFRAERSREEEREEENMLDERREYERRQAVQEEEDAMYPEQEQYPPQPYPEEPQHADEERAK